jgi:hypothetical protein
VSDTPPTDDPTRANSPDSPGATPGVADRVAPGAPPPGSNQRKDEPIAPARDVGDAAGTIASTHPQSPHAVPPGVEVEAAPSGAAGAPGMTPAQARPTVDLGSDRGGAGSPVSDLGGSASRVPGRQETRQSQLDPVAELDAARTAPGAPQQSVPPGPSAPGNAQGVSVPATESAPGTSQESSIVEGVRSSPGAVPGAPEAVVDTPG